jgi:head-tail adaptor
MIRDKYIRIDKPTFTKDAQGGTTQTLAMLWKGWAQIEEGNYRQAMEFGLPIGQRPIMVKLRKNDITQQIDNTAILTYREIAYNVSMVRELDKFTIELYAVCSRN